MIVDECDKILQEEIDKEVIQTIKNLIKNGGKKWNLTDAIDFLNEIKTLVFPLKWYPAMAGSVLYNGVGNDLDIVMIPFDVNNNDYISIYNILLNHYELIKSPTDMIATWRKKGLTDSKMVLKFKIDNIKEVDFIFPTVNIKDN